jgi:germination protein M
MTIPSEVKLINIETKEGICFVNFSEDLITKHWGGTAGEIFTIYSIVNSLTELDYIDKVQFLIEGKKQETFTHMIFNEPFERDESLIKEII